MLFSASILSLYPRRGSQRESTAVSWLRWNIGGKALFLFIAVLSIALPSVEAQSKEDATPDILVAGAPAVARLEQRTSAEEEMWQRIKNSQKIQDFREFLISFPKGQFAAAASLTISQLSRPADGSSSPDAEQIKIWDDASAKGSCDGFIAYINRFPLGIFIEIAHARLLELYSADSEACSGQTSVLYAVFKNGAANERTESVFASSQTGLGLMLLRGELQRPDAAEAMILFGAAETSGSAEASYQLGIASRDGKGAPINAEKMQDKLLRSAERGHVRAMLALADAYESGEMLKKDIGEALKWFRKAAEFGSLRGQLAAARMLQSGKGGPKAPADAAGYYWMAAKQGSIEAMTSLAWMHENAVGVAADLPFAYSLYSHAANLGDSYGMFKAAWMLELGQGIPASKKDAAEWYFKAAEAQSPQAFARLGAAYENGNLGLKTDKREALAWYLKAAEAGVPSAQFSAAYFYHQGIGASVDYAIAYQWYLRAAESKNPLAFIGLGRLYEEGLGVAPDPALAYVYFVLASKTNETLVRQDIDRLGAILTKSQRARADELLSGELSSER